MRYLVCSVRPWFSGTANAIYQNIAFIENYDPENVLILSGDHIYKMDYSKMLAYHKEKNADCTIAVSYTHLDVYKRQGMPSGRFTFEGFLSVNKASRTEHIQSIVKEPRTMIFYEAPHKIGACLLYTSRCV